MQCEQSYVQRNSSDRRSDAFASVLTSFEHSEQARLHDGGIVGDVVPIKRRKLVAPVASNYEQPQQREVQYLVVDGVEALAKFGENAWWVAKTVWSLLSGRKGIDC